MRDKVKVLFNKGRVRITKTILGKSERKSPYVTINDIISRDPGSFQSRRNEIITQEIKCVSPLGFYYTKTINSYNTTSNKQSSQTTKSIEYYRDDVVHKITYLTEYNGTRVGIETRPWQLGPDACSMPDHQLNALLEIIKGIIEESKGASFVETQNHHKFRSSLMTDLFGDSKGPRFQTDEEKILSHGFDLKESFRNRKEK